MRVYLLQLFYNTLQSVAGDMESIKRDLTSVAGNDWQVLGFGAQNSAIGFRTDAPPAQLQELFRPYGSEQLYFLLTDTTELIDAHMVRSKIAWLETRLKAPPSQP